jgi:hypothetical protein
LTALDPSIVRCRKGVAGEFSGHLGGSRGAGDRVCREPSGNPQGAKRRRDLLGTLSTVEVHPVSWKFPQSGGHVSKRRPPITPADCERRMPSDLVLYPLRDVMPVGDLLERVSPGVSWAHAAILDTDAPHPVRQSLPCLYRAQPRWSRLVQRHTRWPAAQTRWCRDDSEERRGLTATITATLNTRAEQASPVDAPMPRLVDGVDLPPWRPHRSGRMPRLSPNLCQLMLPPNQIRYRV